VVYGADDRVEAYASPDERWRRIGENSVVALIDARYVDTHDPENVRIVSGTLADEGLCADQRFLDQPTAASCSGTLIDDDLVLTAGHCAQALSDCRDWSFVFHYHLAGAGELSKITSEDVFTCRAVVAQRLDGGRETLDYSIVQLDRPATPRHQPAAMRAALMPLPEGSPVTLIGFPSGLPAKVDSGGVVLSNRGTILDYFTATTDSFSGNSGSGVFDGAGNLVGILVRGEDDYTMREGCLVVNVLPNDGSAGYEEATYAVRALEDLCQRGYPSTRLCGAASQTCGDGLCAVPETWQGCPRDCPQPVCGNGRCELGEATTCEVDCGPPPQEVPSSWICPASYYGTRDGCDCDCGALDPDCADPTQEVYNCHHRQVCSPEGICVDPGSLDGGAATPDGGQGADGGLPGDGGTPADGGTIADGGRPPDGGGSTDAGLPPDAGSQTPPRPPGGGCTASASGAETPWPIALLLGLVAWRRSRRQSPG
jgi:V8-like Glu-specific endopeptidase